MTTVTFDQATRTFPGGERPAVDHLDLEIDDGEFLVLVGPSGCGKSTSLRMLAGLEEVDEGAIRIGETDVTRKDPKDRDVAMVFQNYALYPHMSVADNMAFALKIAGESKETIKERVLEAARLLDLEEYLERKPKALSGGQRQRVAMGRAIVRSPQVFLMDEPLSNLDAKLRVQTRSQIAALQRRLGVTTVYVTHDQVEAMTMGDRVAVLRDGILQQVDTPRNMYNDPANIFVAGFIGSPAMNLLELERRAGPGPVRRRRPAGAPRGGRRGRQGRAEGDPRRTPRGHGAGLGGPRTDHRGQRGRGARRRRLRLRFGRGRRRDALDHRAGGRPPAAGEGIRDPPGTQATTTSTCSRASRVPGCRPTVWLSWTRRREPPRTR